MSVVMMYTKCGCSFCIAAKKIFCDLGISYTEIRIDEQNDKRQEMMKLTGRRSVPQIFIRGCHVGGCDDLQEMVRSGHLIQWLKKVNTND